MTTTSSDLALYLGLDAIDTARADFLIAQATSLAQLIVNPVPAGASALILSAAARAYVNPQGVTAETVGPYSVSRPKAGVYFDKSERASLLGLAGRGGAFTVDPTPADAGDGIYPWDLNLWGGYSGVISPDESGMWQ